MQYDQWPLNPKSKVLRDDDLICVSNHLQQANKPMFNSLMDLTQLNLLHSYCVESVYCLTKIIISQLIISEISSKVLIHEVSNVLTS